MQGISTTPRTYLRKAIRPEMTVRQIAADFPGAEEVFRRHGETDAPPARFGHLEPLTHFARRRGVSLEHLLAELAEVTAVPVDHHASRAGRIHHGFLFSALVVTLTLGAGWGAWLLWQIGMDGRFSGVPASFVVAHGEAQLWGFIVLFVMGISLRTVLQGAVRVPGGSRVCTTLLGLTLGGVVGSMAWSLFPGRLYALGLVSAVALCLASLSFGAVQFAVLVPKWPMTWARAVLASGLWLNAWAIVTLWLRWKYGQSGPGALNDSQRLLLIELAVFGFAMNSIYGFGQMLLPGLLRIGNTRDKAIEGTHWAHNAGAIIICLTTGLGANGWFAVAGAVLLVAGAVLFAVGNRGFVGRSRSSDREEQGHTALDFYPPLAFFWLLASLTLLTGGLVYESTMDHPLPHAYMGAVRHALTVGFMTTLILGVGQRLVPVLDRTVLAMPRLVMPTLLLIGAGNLLRVGSELAILVTPSAFRVMPISGLLEWLALLLFSISLVATMFHTDLLLKQGRVARRSSLAVLLAEHPWVEDRLRAGGTGYLLRARSVPDELTIGSFAESEGYDAAELVDRINSWLRDGPAKTLSRGGSLQSSSCAAGCKEIRS